MSSYSIDLDGGNDYLKTDGNLPALTTFSGAFFLKWDDYGTSNLQFIFAGAQEQIEVHTGGGGAGVNGIRIIPNTYGGGANALDATDAIPDGDWHHYGFHFESNVDMAIYRDGVEIASKTHSISTNTTAAPLYIGRRAGGNYYVDGKIDLPMLYNRKLSEAEFASLAAGNSITSGLVFGSELEEGSGTVSDDISTNDNDLTLYGGAAWSTDVPTLGGGAALHRDVGLGIRI